MLRGLARRGGLHDLEVGQVAVRHELLVVGVGLGRQTQGLLVGVSPVPGRRRRRLALHDGGGLFADDDPLGGRRRPGRDRGRQGRRAALGRIRVAVVGAADLQGGLGPGCHGDPRIRRGLLLRPQGRQVQLQARRRGQRGQRLVERGQPVLALAVGGHGGVGAISEDAPHQAGEHRARTHLDEGPHARGVHRLDLLHEPHRLRDGVGQSRPDGRRILAVRRCPCARPRLQRRRRELGVLKRLCERPARARHDRRVERGGHGQPSGPCALGVQGLHRVLHGLGGPADDHLIGCVVVGHDHRVVAQVGEGLAHGVDVQRDRRHRATRGAVGRGAGHQLAPGPGHGEEPGLIQHPGRGQRRDLAKAVARGAGRLQTELPQHLPRRQARHPDGRLGPLGPAQPRLVRRAALLVEGRRGEDHLVQPAALGELAVRRAIPDPTRRRQRHGEIASHAHALAALPREEEADRPRGALARAQGVPRPTRQAQLLFGRPIDGVCGAPQALGKIRRVLGDHRQSRSSRLALGALPAMGRPRQKAQQPLRAGPRLSLVRQRPRLRGQRRRGVR